MRDAPAMKATYAWELRRREVITMLGIARMHKI
jgi:hypothetical protein